MSSPLLEPSLAMMKTIADSKKSAWLDPSRSRILNYLLRISIYGQFCAGATEDEVRRTVSEMKAMGFTGVILGYARDAVVMPQKGKGKTIAKVDGSSTSLGPGSELTQKHIVLSQDSMVDAWKEGNLRTLRMIGEGDYLAIKFTGAGQLAIESLSRGDAVPPRNIQDAMLEICEMTKRQKSRLWVDAEQQIFQPAIDAWTIDLMRRFNRDGDAVVFTTIQAYLKSSAANVERHLDLARDEGWTLGIKLVRGAYISHEIRDRIHDTKEETDRNYDRIVERLLMREYINSASSSIEQSRRTTFPSVRLFVASHNAESVRKAYLLRRERVMAGKPTIPVEFGQLQGMADEVSCELLAEKRRVNTDAYSGEEGSGGSRVDTAPRAFKCLAWGSMSECLQFLVRRAVENQGAVQRSRHMAAALREEMWRRVFSSRQS